ncbi:MAG: hypothetical protein ACRD29_04455 [Acidimicrobiales bacterium]
MSLWTPQGEHPVGDDDGGGGSGGGPAPAGGPATDVPLGGAADAADLTDEQREELEAMAAEMAEVQRRLASVPAAQVIANHVIGMFELAAIHLHAQPPNLEEARLAIDAMAAVVDALGSRLESHEAPLRDALAQIRLAFVQLQAAGGAGAARDPAD